MDALQAYALSKKYTKESLQGAGAIKGEDGFSPTITESQDNSDSEYRLDITNKNGTFKTPNLKGEKGEPGPTGAQGVQGIKGDRGQQGEQGIQGIQGIPGPKGDDGYPFLIYKEYATLSDFNAADFPEIGLMFMVKEKELGAFPVYRFTGDEEEPYSYVTGLSDSEGIKGDKGDPGEQGPQGVPGKDGKDGTTYTPTIGSVTSGQTADASVILDDDKKTAEFNFVLPKGEPGEGAETPLEISQQPGNAITEKEDGIFVHDNSEDIGKLQKDVNNVSNKVDTIKKYQRYVNTELDYAYLRTNLVSSLALKTDTVIPFDTFVGGSGIEIDLENYGVVLKAGKTYKLTCNMRISSTAGYITAGFYDIEKNKYLSMLSKVTSNYSVSSDNGCGFLVITPTKDTTIQVRVAGLNGTATFTTAANNYNILIVEEINRSIVIDPVEHVNAESGIEDTPVGHILTHMGTKAPKHYLVCDGTEYPIADYPYLAQHFIDDFGSVNYFGGDGENTFAVPDLRGEFLRGSGENLHENQGGGGNVGDHQDASLHPGIMYNNPYITYNRAGYNADLDECNYDYVSDTPSQIVVANGSTSNNQYRTNVNNYTSRPTNTSVLWCIKYEPTYFMKVTGHIYSYEERLVGTWVDGKPLYEKTVDFGNLPNAATKEVPHGIENVDVIWVHDGYAQSGDLFDTLVHTDARAVTYSWQTLASKTSIRITTGTNRSSIKATVTLRYTKTTD